MDVPRRIEWLLENGGPAIRFRTAAELVKDRSIDLRLYRAELLESPLVKTWLENLGPRTSFTQLHGSPPTTFENAMGKLIQLGCRCGMPAFDQKTAPFRRWLDRNLSDPPPSFWNHFMRAIVNAFLVMAGYHQDEAVRAYLLRRLDTLYTFTRQKDYDITIDPAGYPAIPKGFRGKQFVNPALYPDGEQFFPLIYDLYALAHLPQELMDESIKEEIETVVDYVLQPEYQALPEGYGMMLGEGRRYYSIGWSVHLSGYKGYSKDSRQAGRYVSHLALMAHFPAARRSRWFQEGLAHLQSFRTGHGGYLFPRTYLPERPSGYWVTAAYMGLEDNRRTMLALELESTFWMTKIEQLTANSPSLPNWNG